MPRSSPTSKAPSRRFRRSTTRSKIAKLRLFIAIPLPVQGIAKSALDQLGIDRRRVAPEQLHVTLKFLGDVADSAVADIEGALATIRWAPFTVVCNHLGCFPKRGKPRIVWLSAVSPALDDLAHAIDQALDLARDQPFIGHVTLARLRQAPSGLRQQLAEFAIAESAHRVDSFTLFASTLTPQGAIYQALRLFEAPARAT